MAPTDTVLQKEGSSYQKYHLPKMEPNINGISQLQIGFLKYYQHAPNTSYPYNH